MQNNASQGVVWVEGIEHPTFSWDLKNRLADYTSVNAALDKVPQDISVYTDETVSVLKQAIDSIDTSLSAADQSKVDDMAKAIEDAIVALEYKNADYSKVDAAIAKANDLNKDDYKDFSKVEAAIAAVVRDKKITEQAEVDAMAKAIEDAINALEKKAAVTSADPDKGDTNVPETGDSSNMALWIALLFVSGTGLFGATAFSKKKKYSK